MKWIAEIANVVMVMGLGLTASRLLRLDTTAGVAFIVFMIGFIFWKNYDTRAK